MSFFTDVAELVDAPDLGSGRFPVRVQVPLSVFKIFRITKRGSPRYHKEPKGRVTV